MSFVDPRTILARHGLKPKKSFGQNFLVAAGVVEKIAALCVAAGEETRVVEIGAGVGTLTSALLDRAASVVAIERDRELVPVLRHELADPIARGALTVIEDDAATTPIEPHFLGVPGAHILAGNLPYSITGRLVERAVGLAARPGVLDRVVVMVQREVGDRLVAPPASEAYGQLSVFVQAAFTVQRGFVVSAGCFHPAPNVESVVVVMRPHATVRAIETETFRRVVHAAFGARRKTLKNALSALLQHDARARVEATGIDLGRRGETLSVEEFAAIAHAIDGDTG